MQDFSRLSALDAMYLGIETHRLHMHVGAILIFERGPLETPVGGIDFQALTEYMERALATLPNFRRRLKKIPGLRHPVWIDDPHFQLDYHLRQTALPKPGNEQRLKRLAGRIFSQGLDRTRPLWEIWVVEGLQDRKFALIVKVHHAMVDGMGGLAALAGILRFSPKHEMGTPVEVSPWIPQPAPSGIELLKNELRYRSRGIAELAQRAKTQWDHIRANETPLHLRDIASTALSLIKGSVLPAPPTSINPRHIGPHRRIDVFRANLSECKQIKNALGGKLNDMILALCAGALRRCLIRRGDNVDELEKFRVMMPVSPPGKSHHKDGNHIVLAMVELPLHIPDPLWRYQQILQLTIAAKEESHQIDTAVLLEEVADVTTSSLMLGGVHLAGSLRPYNVIITNMPGPPVPMYLLGSRLQEMIPLVPLFQQQGLGIAVFSYDGNISIGLSSARETLPKLYEFVDDFQQSFEELQQLVLSVE